MRLKWMPTPIRRELLLISLLLLNVVAIPFTTTREGILNEGVLVKQSLQTGELHPAKGKLELYYLEPEVQTGSDVKCDPTSCNGYVCCLTKEGHGKFWNIHIR